MKNDPVVLTFPPKNEIVTSISMKTQSSKPFCEKPHSFSLSFAVSVILTDTDHVVVGLGEGRIPAAGAAGVLLPRRRREARVAHVGGATLGLAAPDEGHLLTHHLSVHRTRDPRADERCQTQERNVKHKHAVLSAPKMSRRSSHILPSVLESRVF